MPSLYRLITFTSFWLLASVCGAWYLAAREIPVLRDAAFISHALLSLAAALLVTLSSPVSRLGFGPRLLVPELVAPALLGLCACLLLLPPGGRRRWAVAHHVVAYATLACMVPWAMRWGPHESTALLAASATGVLYLESGIMARSELHAGPAALGAYSVGAFLFNWSLLSQAKAWLFAPGLALVFAGWLMGETGRHPRQSEGPS